MKVFYLCNGKNPYCGHSAGCYQHGGECQHTSQIEYGSTPFCQDPSKCPERFEAVKNSDGDYDYFEKSEALTK